MHECPCCGDDYVYSDDLDEPCSCCKAVGCETYLDVDGDIHSRVCNIPMCPECDTRMTFMTNGQWSDNCEPEDCARIACKVHDDCRAHPELGQACRAEHPYDEEDMSC